MNDAAEKFEVQGSQVPLTTIKKPSLSAPAGATDCHFHIFGPHARYPLHPARTYTPHEASVAEYEAMAAVLGIARMVVVQPSIYGTDNRCTIDAVAAFGQKRARAVAVLDENATTHELRKMHEQGVRGVRFNAVNGNGTPLEQLRILARRIAPFGWHVQLYLEGEQLLELAPALGALALPVVIDHMGGISSDKGVEHAQFQALLRLLDTGRTWVKLCAYRSSVAGHPFTDMAPMGEALIAAAVERCLWGTDWPHPSYMRKMPDDGELLDLLGTWAPAAAAQRQILAENPMVLYGFQASLPDGASA